MTLAERLGVRLRSTAVAEHVVRAFPVEACRGFEARHGGQRYTFADGTYVTCSGVGTAIAVCGETRWPVALLSSGERLYLDERGAVYTWHEMEGAAERLGDGFESWLAWTARDAERSAPAPALLDVDAALAAALDDVPADAPVGAGAATATDLEALLDDVGLPALQPFVAAEERWGGLVTRWIRVGPFQMLRDTDFFGHRTAPLGDRHGVLVGEMHDALLYLAPDGALWRVSPLDRGGVARRVASSLRAWLTRAAFVHQICERSAIVVQTTGLEPRELAAVVGAEAASETAGDGSIWVGDDAVVLGGADPFAPDTLGTSVYVARTEMAAVIVGAVAAHGGACRLASAPWPSTWPPVLRSRFDDALAPGLARMARRASPAVTRSIRPASEAPPLVTEASATPLLPAWPDERGAIRCRDGAIEQVRGAAGRMVLTQRFSEEEEHQVAFTGLAAEGVERDPRWCDPARLSEPAAGVERQHGGMRWRRRDRGHVVDGWLGLGASQRWGHPPIIVDGARLLPLGEEGPYELFLAPTGGVWRRLTRPHASICHPGHLPREVAPSVDALLARFG